MIYVCILSSNLVDVANFNQWK